MGGTAWGQGTAAIPPPKENAPLIEPLDTRAKVAIAVLALAIVADVFAVVADAQLLDAANQLIDGERVPFGELRDVDDRVQSSGIAQLVVLILGAITFLLWFHRAWKNAIAMGVSNPRVSTGWAVGWWFIPFANIVMPKNVANDIYRGSGPDMAYNEPSFKNRPVSPVLHFWWAAWLLSWGLSRAAGSSALEARNAEDIKTQATIYLLSDGFDIVAACLAIAVVWTITQMSEERRRLFPDRIPGAVPTQPPPPPPPPPPPH